MLAFKHCCGKRPFRIEQLILSTNLTYDAEGQLADVVDLDGTRKQKAEAN